MSAKKHMTNTRSAGADEAYASGYPTIFSLEQSLEFIKPDELVEITPHHIRLRKRILDMNSASNMKPRTVKRK